MANLRVVYENYATLATITASSTAGSLVASNLAGNIKSTPWRSGAGTTPSLTVTFASTKQVSCVSLPFTNLTANATMRVRLYTLAADANPVLDSGYKNCTYGFQGNPVGVNSFAYAGAASATVWTTPTNCMKVVIDFADATNPLNYIEASCLVVGNYWSPSNNAEYDPQLTLEDRTENIRTDAGDLRSDRGTMNKTLSFNIPYMTTVERNQFWNVMKSGKYSPILVSLIPESSDAEDQLYTIYGKMTNSSAVTYKYFNQHATQMEIEEI
jgi:hypothetical protein